MGQSPLILKAKKNADHILEIPRIRIMHVKLGLRINVLKNFRDQRRPSGCLVTFMVQSCIHCITLIVKKKHFF